MDDTCKAHECANSGQWDRVPKGNPKLFGSRGVRPPRGPERSPGKTSQMPKSHPPKPQTLIPTPQAVDPKQKLLAERRIGLLFDELEHSERTGRPAGDPSP